MIAARNGTLVLMCALCIGCFLDEAPRTAATNETKTGSVKGDTAGNAGSRSGFVPRDPGVATGRTPDMDAAAVDAAVSDASAGEPSPEPDAATPQTPRDAGRPRAMDAQVAMDAGAPKPDATVTTMPPPPDAQAATDTGTPHTPDAQTPADAAVPPPALPMPIHRYEFSGMGRVAVDSIAGADGQLRPGSVLDGAGAVTLRRAADVGVELPTGLLADLTAFTIVGWLDVRTDECWQRLFDFLFVNQRSNGNGGSEPQVSALFVTPFGCPDQVPTAAYVTQQNQIRVESPRRLLRQSNVMLGVTYDSATRMLQLIVDGEVQREARVPINMRQLGRASAGLGRSYSEGDPALNGSISEFRIYSQTLDAAALSELFRRGPDQL